MLGYGRLTLYILLFSVDTKLTFIRHDQNKADQRDDYSYLQMHNISVLSRNFICLLEFDTIMGQR